MRLCCAHPGAPAVAVPGGISRPLPGCNRYPKSRSGGLGLESPSYVLSSSIRVSFVSIRGSNRPSRFPSRLRVRHFACKGPIQGRSRAGKPELRKTQHTRGLPPTARLIGQPRIAWPRCGVIDKFSNSAFPPLFPEKYPDFAFFQEQISPCGNSEAEPYAPIAFF